MSYTIGILGGMGPMTTIDFAKKIIEYTPAKIDQDHQRMLIYNNPKIPSRIDAILAGGISPLSELIQSAKKLENAGADFIIIPCNTAHYWYEDLCKSIKIPIISLIKITVENIINGPASTKGGILLLATEATVKTGLYQNELDKYGLEILIPNSKGQVTITEAIKAVKAGLIETNPHLLDVNKLLQDYRLQGVSTVIAGCTEVSMLLPYLTDWYEKINPLEIMARKIALVS